MNKIYLENLTINNEDGWKLFTLSKEDSLKYFEYSNKNNVTLEELNIPNTEVNNCNYINLTNKILYSILSNDNMKFLSIIDDTFYEVYNIIFNYKDAPIILYYCNINDPFILVQTSSYMDFEYIIYINNKEIINISKSTAVDGYYLPEIFESLKIKNTTTYNENKFIKHLFFGFNHNTGHHIWNEISGLFYFLQNKKYHDKINGIIIGPYDSFNIKTYLKNNTNINVIDFNDFFGKCYHNCNINLNNIFPVFLNSYYIDKNIKNIINPIVLQENNEINNILEVSIDIRATRRYLINQDIFYTKLIQNLIDNYNNYLVKINFIGCFETNINFITSDNIEYIEQNKIANNIIQNFSNNENVIFENFIGKKFCSIVNSTINSKLFISSFGTSVSNLMNWIYNTKQIVFGPLDSYNWLFIQYNILKNFDVIAVPKEYITLSNGLQEPFDVDYILFNTFLNEQINDILKII
jgi:hypothetical protein